MDSFFSSSSLTYVFTLYISGMHPRSLQAVGSVKKFLESSLQGRYILKVVDLTKDYSLHDTEKIFAVPTLVRNMPLPVKKFIGDMNKVNQLFAELDIE